MQVIPHGVPVVSFRRDSYKARLGLSGRPVICTFGLINRGKGLEYMIQAMPRFVAACPEAVYLIVGATHPQVKRQEGESIARAWWKWPAVLGVADHVRFVNQYLSLSDLLLHLKACDVYVTPYPGKEQIASGTLAYALAAGGAVVSTSYLYAQEVLADGRGLLVPPCQSSALADATLRYLRDAPFLLGNRRGAYEYAKPMFWPNVGWQYLDLCRRVRPPARPVGGLTTGKPSPHPLRSAPPSPPRRMGPTPPMPLPSRRGKKPLRSDILARRLCMPVNRIVLKHLDRMSDSTGLIQHAFYSLPRRESGYTTDDNARALGLCVRLWRSNPANAC